VVHLYARGGAHHHGRAGVGAAPHDGALHPSGDAP
jgi:hypothetical protein